jgi:hypothetical protein
MSQKSSLVQFPKSVSQVLTGDRQNAYAEGVIGSIKRELLDHVFVVNEKHLRKLLRRYADYYNGYRTHLGLEKDAPLGRKIQHHGKIFATPKLGGLHHVYLRE